MRSVSAQIVILGLVMQWGCQSTVNHTAIQSPILTEKEVIEIANQEVRCRGIDPQYKVEHVSKLSTKIIVDVSLSHESCAIIADENGRAVEIKGKNPEKYSFLKNPSSKPLMNEEEAKKYFSGQFKKFLRNDPVRELDCYYFPKGWMLFYGKEFILSSGEHFSVIIREDGTFHGIVPGK